MKIKCVECDQLIIDDKVYHYKGKSYCDDCYKMINAVDRENKNKTISSKYLVNLAKDLESQVINNHKPQKYCRSIYSSFDPIDYLQTCPVDPS